MAGLGAAWLLQRDHDVTVFEAAPRVGGHAHTVSVEINGESTWVDTGFIVYNDVNYPNLIKLFDALGVPTEPSNMSFSVSVGRRFEYAGSVGGLLADPLNALRPRMWRLLGDIRRFYATAPSLLNEQADEELTLGAYLTGEGYSEAFVRDHLLPMGAAIWSCTPDDMLGFPAVSFVRFFENHGLLRLKGRPAWRTVSGGSRNYVSRLTEPFADRIRTNCPVHAVRRYPKKVTLTTNNGNQDFDQVVIAIHGDQALELLRHDASGDERRLLGAFRYQSNVAVLHGDTEFMPRRRGAWSSWNYLVDDENRSAPPAVTYWMNRLQNIDSSKPLFVSLNPPRLPAEALRYGVFEYDHPVFSADAIRAQASFDRLQGQRRTWFCGSYHGYGFHEDALTSACHVATALGVRPDWWGRSPEPRAVTLAAA